MVKCTTVISHIARCPTCMEQIAEAVFLINFENKQAEMSRKGTAKKARSSRENGKKAQKR